MDAGPGQRGPHVQGYADAAGTLVSAHRRMRRVQVRSNTTVRHLVWPRGVHRYGLAVTAITFAPPDQSGFEEPYVGRRQATGLSVRQVLSGEDSSPPYLDYNQCG